MKYCIAIMGVLVISSTIGVYNYKDCKKVGHSDFYCIMHFGR